MHGGCASEPQQRDDVLVRSGSDDRVGCVLGSGRAPPQQVEGAFAAGVHQPVGVVGPDVLGADERLIAAVCDRIAATGVRGDHGIALTAVGSSSAVANARTADVARRIELATGRRTEICFATTEPSVRQAISALDTDRVVVAPWLLAPGLLLDRVAAAAPGAVFAATIGNHPLLTDLVLDRYRSCLTRDMLVA